MSALSAGVAEDLLRTNRDDFEHLVARARHAFAVLGPDVAAARIQSAARYAWRNHPGSFRNAELEDLACRIAEGVKQGSHAEPRFHGHVLHVATQLYATGGHTRLISRWIENDAARTHSLVLTAQGGLAVPDHVRAAVSGSGGGILDLARISSTLTGQAQKLRAVAQSALAVVLHIHPHDVVPSLALRDGVPPVVFLNHADHVFSLGLDVSKVVADIRPAGRSLSLAARGVSLSSSALLPIPLVRPRELDRTEARLRWSIPEHAVVILSIASEYKYGAPDGEHFVDAHIEFMREHPDVHMIIVGPRPQGRWKEFERATSGRGKAIGVVAAVDDLYAVADVYVDSIPFASLTSLLDAAARGVPVLALSGGKRGTVLSSDDAALPEGTVHFADRGAYLDRLGALVNDAMLRARVGVDTRRAVFDWHMAPGWNHHLDDLFKRLSDFEGSFVHARADPSRFAELNEELVIFQRAAGLSEPVWRSELLDAPLQPLRRRLSLVSRVPRGRRLRSVGYLLSAGLRARLGAVGRRILRTR